MSTEGSKAGPRVFGGDDNKEVEEDEEYVSDESEPSGKRHKASDIWEGFWILKQRGNSSKCFACRKILANSGKSGASLLMSLANRTGPDFNAARRAMSMFIISSGESLLVVEDYYFQQLSRSLNPTFPICRAILDRDVMNLYEREKDTLVHIIAQASGGLSFSIDHWKSKATGDKYRDDSYVCVTACFVDADWNMRRRVVGFRFLRFSDDAPSVTETIASCFVDLGIDKKVLSITFDNTLDDASVANSLKTLLHEEGKFLYDGELFPVHCCTEVLNSAVKAGLELISDVIDKIRHGIHYINYSVERKVKFYQSSKDVFHLDVINTKLRSDIVVYWDLTYKMLGCVLNYKDALNHFASTDETFLAHFHLDDEEWNKVASMEKFLKVLYDITCTFLSKESKTASMYFLGVYKVYRLLDVTKCQENFMSAMVGDIKAKFDKYWSEYSLILACAAVFDPRYKLSIISYCFRKIYGDVDASQHITRVVALLNRLFTEHEKSSCSSSGGTNVLECHTKDDLFDDYSPPKQISELDWYLESPVMDLSVDLDILKFWSGMSKCYPDLASLARDILAIPVSTVATKSAFTMGEKVLNQRRSGLSSDLLEMLICLHDWTSPKDRNGISVSAIEEYCTDDDEEEEDDEVEKNREEPDDNSNSGADCGGDE